MSKRTETPRLASGVQLSFWPTKNSAVSDDYRPVNNPNLPMAVWCGTEIRNRKNPVTGEYLCRHCGFERTHAERDNEQEKG